MKPKYIGVGNMGRGYMSKIYFEVEGDIVVKRTPIPEIGENIYKNEVVMTKDVFQECYEMWIKQEPEKIGHCKECKYFGYDILERKYFCKRWCDGIIHCRVKEDGYCFLFEPMESEVSE